MRCMLSMHIPAIFNPSATHRRGGRIGKALKSSICFLGHGRRLLYAASISPGLRLWVARRAGDAVEPEALLLAMGARSSEMTAIWSLIFHREKSRSVDLEAMLLIQNSWTCGSRAPLVCRT